MKYVRTIYGPYGREPIDNHLQGFHMVVIEVQYIFQLLPQQNGKKTQIKCFILNLLLWDLVVPRYVRYRLISGQSLVFATLSDSVRTSRFPNKQKTGSGVVFNENIWFNKVNRTSTESDRPLYQPAAGSRFYWFELKTDLHIYLNSSDLNLH